MDVRIYYRKVQEQEDRIAEDAVVVKSLETPDGGKAGLLTEVSKRNAAILITEGKAELASPQEARRFRDEAKSAKLAVERQDAARRIQMSLVPTMELANLKAGQLEVKE